MKWELVDILILKRKRTLKVKKKEKKKNIYLKYSPFINSVN